MVVIGVVLFAAAVAAALILAVQNRGSIVEVRALGHTWLWHQYWVLAAGLVIAFVALLGLSAMWAGAANARRLRRERAELLAENAALGGRLSDPDASPFFDDGTDRIDRHDQRQPLPQQTAQESVKRRRFRRTKQAV